MSEPDQSSEGPGMKPGGIAGPGTTPTTAQQFGEGPGNQLCWSPGGISESVGKGKGVKRRLQSHSYQTKYEAIIDVERGLLSKKKVAEKFGVPANTLSTWLKKADEIKIRFLSGDMEPNRKKVQGVQIPGSRGGRTDLVQG